MRSLRSPLLTLACLGLLGSQLTGLHMHMNADGYVGLPEGTHVHGAAAVARGGANTHGAAALPREDAHARDGHAGHAQAASRSPGHADHGHPVPPGPDHAEHEHPLHPDHGGERDVSIVDLGAGASKLLILFAWLAIGFGIVLAPARGVRPVAVVPPPRSRRDRWRPPLRAPPLLCQRSNH